MSAQKINKHTRLRIGIDARLWNETGVGRYIRNLYAYLPTLDKQNEYVWFFLEKEFKTINLPNKNWRKVKANIHWHTFSEQSILPWIFSKEKLDILHFPYFSFPILYPGRFIINVYDLIYDHYKTVQSSTLPPWLYTIKMNAYRLILWIAMRRAASIVTLSNDAKSEICNHYNIPPDRITVTYEAGELEDKTKDFKKNKYKKISNLQPYILYVGTAHPHKNVESLILALKEIIKKQKTLKLVLIGDDSYFYPKLKDFSKRHGLSKHVLFVGSILNSNIRPWYTFATCFVTASKMEGFGIPPLEAMSVGCPVIVSDIPVFHEVYGNSAMYFDHNDWHNIAKTILNTIENKTLIRTMIQKGYKQESLYSWEKTIRETIAIYNKIANAHS